MNIKRIRKSDIQVNVKKEIPKEKIKMNFIVKEKEKNMLIDYSD